MSYSVKQGQVYIGSVVAAQLSIVQGDLITIRETPLYVARVLEETGSMDDIRIYGHMKTVQKLLNRTGVINEITALQCLCLEDSEDPITKLREQLKIVLPDCHVIMNKTIAQARKRQRTMADKYFI